MSPRRPPVPRPPCVLTPGAAELIRREIRRAGGAEVCFVARAGEDGAVEEPRAVARGHASATLAAVGDAEPGGMVLHNHPSGVLAPSDADLAAAAALWERGWGFAITDNDAAELYVVVEPPAAERLEPLDAERVAAELAPGSGLAARHPRYEDRPQQRALTRAVVAAYNDGGITVAEAGTGTGKSVAYLLPAIRWALQNGERTVVSTNTINLQEQLVSKDLPLLRRALGEPFRFALVKGRRNYISIRRALLAKETAGALLDPARQAELASVLEWTESTAEGSLSDLSFRPSAELWDEVSSESDVCLRARCPHFEECFYQRARRDAAAADVVVVNHHLLFSDLAVRRTQGNYTAPAVLPPYRRLILDEAHNLEEAATGHLGASVSRRGLFRVLRRLEQRGKGLLPALAAALRAARPDLLGQSALELLHERLLPAVEGARERAGAVFLFLEEAFAGSAPTTRLDSVWDEHPVWTLGLGEALDGLLANLAELLRDSETLRERVATDEALRAALEAQLLELRGACNRLEGASDALRFALRPPRDASPMVRWIERQPAREGREGNLVLAAAPLDLSRLLREGVWERVPTVVLTSATLATQGHFRFVRERLGLAEPLGNEAKPVAEAIFPSPFDYAGQSLLAVPTDLPLPAGELDPRHDEATVRATLEHARISDGGVFVLFTSYRALRHVAAELRRRGADATWPLFVHGEGPRGQLVERFAASGRGILLGTVSFWEGVDVPGEALRGLVIPRLPFRVPSEPVTAARIEAIEAAGGNAFAQYQLPHAAIRLKQGFGRLIRSQEDRGVVLLLDGRLARRSYGRYFRESLPPARYLAAPWQTVRTEMVNFYAACDSVRRAS